MDTHLTTEHTIIRISPERMMRLQREAMVVSLDTITDRLADVERGLRMMPPAAPTELDRPYRILQITYQAARHAALGEPMCAQCGLSPVAKEGDHCISCDDEEEC